MNQIKFSHNYLKLPPNWQGKKATLLFVREIELEKQTPAFLNYDTMYEISEEGTYQDERGIIRTRIIIRKMNYPLPPKGKYLLLLFECEGTIFTTLRKVDGFNSITYKGLGGEEFELVKTEEEKK